MGMQTALWITTNQYSYTIFLIITRSSKMQDNLTKEYKKYNLIMFDYVVQSRQFIQSNHLKQLCYIYLQSQHHVDGEAQETLIRAQRVDGECIILFRIKTISTNYPCNPILNLLTPTRFVYEVFCIVTIYAIFRKFDITLST